MNNLQSVSLFLPEIILTVLIISVIIYDLLIDKSKINNIKIGNITDNFDVVKDADWIVEAVVERIDVKHQIYEKIFKARKKDAIVSSNTSSIPIKVLSQHLTDVEKKDFCITSASDV